MNAALLFGLAVGVSAPALKDPPRNASDIIGEWVVESVTIRGTQRQTANLVYTFTKDGKWIIHRDDNEVPTVHRTYTSNPKALPPTVELMSSMKGGDISRREGIYKVEGDTLTICVAEAGKARPEKIESNARTGQTTYVLKRKK